MNPEDLMELMAPTMPLEPVLPMELTVANQQWQLADPEATLSLIDNHTFPWNGLILIIIIFVTIYGLKTIKRPPPKPQEITARIQAKALKVIQGTPSLQNYISLTQNLRDYFANRLGSNLQGKTTDELLESLQQTPLFDSKSRQLLRTVLEESDLVKFAQHTPTLTNWLRTRRSVEKLLR